MRFFAPTNVYIEKDCVKAHKQELTSLGTKAFIITGRHSAAANGSLDDVTAVLSESSIPYVIFNEIEENPSTETVARAAKTGIDEQVDFVIGIGGGSPLDAGKAIALLVANPGETEDCLYKKKDLAAPLPFVAVPTTCGTGSEVTPNAVLTRHAIGAKGSISYNIYPRLALVDGKYLTSASKKLLINTAVDALAHLVESRLHRKSNIYNQMFSEYGIKLWADVIPYLQGEKEADEKAYEHLMLTSTVAGMAIAQTGTSLPHALSYPITLTYDVPHGRACGLTLAAYMEEYAKNKPEDVDRILSLLGLPGTDEFGALLKDLLGPQSIEAGKLTDIAEKMAANAGKLATYPFEIGREGLIQILTKSLVVE